MTRAVIGVRYQNKDKSSKNFPSVFLLVSFWHHSLLVVLLCFSYIHTKKRNCRVQDGISYLTFIYVYLVFRFCYSQPDLLVNIKKTIIRLNRIANGSRIHFIFMTHLSCIFSSAIMIAVQHLILTKKMHSKKRCFRQDFFIGWSRKRSPLTVISIYPHALLSFGLQLMIHGLTLS